MTGLSHSHTLKGQTRISGAGISRSATALRNKSSKSEQSRVATPEIQRTLPSFLLNCGFSEKDQHSHRRFPRIPSVCQVFVVCGISTQVEQSHASWRSQHYRTEQDAQFVLSKTQEEEADDLHSQLPCIKRTTIMTSNFVLQRKSLTMTGKSAEF